MTQTVPATAVLGPGKTGLTIGLTVLNIDGTEYAAFSATGVAETSVAGTYRKAGGVVCPDAGGYIVWGVSGTDYAEATVESTAVNVTLWKGVDATTAVIGADGDTLKSLSDQIDGKALEATAQAILEDTGTTLPGTLATIAGYIDTEVAAILAAVDTEVAAILADTNELQTDLVNGGRLDLLIDAIKAKTDNLPSDPADQSAVEAAITSATSPLATGANLATLAGYVDTEVASILAAVDTEVAAILADTNELQTDWANGGRLDLILDARSSQTSVDDLPTNSELATALASADDAVLSAIADVPTVAEFEARTLLAADYTVVGDLPSVPSTADIKTELEADGSKLDHLWEMTEDDGGVRRLTANALEEAPAGGSGTADWTSDEREQIRYRLQLDGTQTAPMDADPPAVNVTMWKGSTAPAMTGDSYARLGAPVGASVSADIAAVASAVASVGAGDGAGFYTDTVESPTGTPLDGVRVVLATDEDGDIPAYEARTDAFGVFAMRPDPGTYYLFIEAAGHDFTQGTEVTVVEP